MRHLMGGETPLFADGRCLQAWLDAGGAGERIHAALVPVLVLTFHPTGTAAAIRQYRPAAR
jgi:hypothetical protein